MAKSSTTKKTTARKTTKKKPSKKVQSTQRADLLQATKPPRHSCLKMSCTLLGLGIESANSLATLYKDAQKARGGGAPTHAEQDLLRAMLITASTTIDAVLKQMIRDALPHVIQCNDGAMKNAIKHVERKIIRDIDKSGGERFAKVLLSDRPRDDVIGYIIDDTTGESLQSESEIHKVANLLGLAGFKPLPGLKSAFDARNQIIHELDWRPPSGAGNTLRRQRKQEEMRGYATSLLQTANSLLMKVDEVLSK